ncbi:MAG: hypothetical protein Q7J26_00015, partial [Brevundimonas sp.]|uniref:hypothetical protein n=1 Tax=Brevundimonas sp. TaxID=1871086 RepID=UPI00271A60F6
SGDPEPSGARERETVADSLLNIVRRAHFAFGAAGFRVFGPSSPSPGMTKAKEPLAKRTPVSI